ncbi:MAG: ABC transporter substrate-binding protein [Eubacteriales bacterium]|nr:ABC transporter substrate-binding protein [Eubacteriales bacterium]
MKKIMWVVSVILLLAVAVLLWQQMQNTLYLPKETTEITILHAWGTMEEDHKRMRDIFQDFEKEHPVRLHLLSMPSGKELLNKLEDLLQVGKVPDVVSFAGIGYNHVYEYMVQKNLALDLQPYIEQHPSFATNLAKQNIEKWMQNEKLYTLSDVLILSGGYWCNQDMLQKLHTSTPKTWEDLFALCEAIQLYNKENGTEIYPFAFSNEAYLNIINHLFYQEHITTLRAENVSAALDLLKKLYMYSYPIRDYYTYRDETRLFNTQKTLLYMNGVWAESMIYPEIKAEYALLPYKEQSMASITSDLAYVVGHSDNVEKTNASLQFVDYMLSEAVQQRILNQTRQVPANPKVQFPKTQNMLRLGQAVEMVQSAQMHINNVDGIWKPNQKEVFLQNIVPFLQNKISKEQFLQDLQVH